MNNLKQSQRNYIFGGDGGRHLSVHMDRFRQHLIKLLDLVIDRNECLMNDTGTNEVSGTSEFLPLEPPVRVTGAGKSSLRKNPTKLSRLHIFKGRDLGDGLK